MGDVSAAPNEAVTVGEVPGVQVHALSPQQSAKVRPEHLAAMNSLYVRLMQTPDAANRLRLLCELVIGEAFMARAVVPLRLTRTEAGLNVRPLIKPVKTSAFHEMMPLVSRRVLKTIVRGNLPVMATTGMGDHPGAIDMTYSAERTGYAVMACPMGQGPGYRDVFYATYDDELASMEWLALLAMAVQQYHQGETAWAARIGAERQAALEQDLARAKQIQQRLIPTHARVPGLDLAICYQPCRWVGGDYVDVVAMPDGRTMLMVADVCGKGLGAAMICSNVHAMTHASLRAGASLAQTVSSLNAHLMEYLEEGSFVTLAAVAIDPRTGLLECINAGHLPPLILDRAGQCRILQQAEHLPLGLATEHYGQEHAELSHGQMLALYTDGLTEMKGRDGHMPGVEGVARQIGQLRAARPAADPQEIAVELNLWLDLQHNGQPAEDDVTFLLAARSAVRI